MAFFADDYRVSRVVAAGHPRDVIERTRQVIDDLPFAFVSPLRTNHYDRFHADLLLAENPAALHHSCKLPKDSGQ
jgi:hypothetical protein